MARWFEFIGNHPVLFGIMGVLVVLFFMVENKRGGKKIAPNAVGMMVNQQNAKLIDIRPKAKFEAGYIQGSRNIPFTELQNHLAELKAATTPLIIICEMGLQASAAVALIGKPEVYRLEGGITNWQSSGMPLVGNKNKK